MSEPVLTKRELDYVKLAADGLTSKGMAEKLGLTPLGVKATFSKFTKRFNTTKTGLVAIALRNHWIE